MIRMSIMVPEEVYEKLRKDSFTTKKSMSQLLVEGVGGIKKTPREVSKDTPIVKPLMTGKELLDKLSVPVKTIAVDPEQYCNHLKKYKDCNLHG